MRIKESEKEKVEKSGKRNERRGEGQRNAEGEKKQNI